MRRLLTLGNARSALLTISIGLMLGAWNAHSRLSYEQYEKASKEADSILVIDFADCVPGITTTKRVEIINKTSGDVALTSIDWDCECLAVAVEKPSAWIGHRLAFTASFVAPMTPGEFSHELRLQYNPPECLLPHIVRIVGTVGSWVTLNPPHIQFDVVPYGTRKAVTLNMKAIEPWTDDARSVFCGMENLTVTFLDATDDLKECNYRVEYDATKDIFNQKVSGEIYIAWKGQRTRKLTIPISVEVIPGLKIDPLRVNCGNCKPGEDQSFKLSVSDTRGQTLACTDVEVSVQGPDDKQVNTRLLQQNRTVIICGSIQSAKSTEDRHAALRQAYILIKRKPIYRESTSVKVPITWID